MTNSMSKSINRRSFVRGGLTIAGATTMGAGLLTHSSPLLAQGASLSSGDAALLRFAAAAEILESDFWVQYNELGGIPDPEVPDAVTPTTRISTLISRSRKQFPIWLRDRIQRSPELMMI